MRYYVIAGEASGDLHASRLVAELSKLEPDAAFRGWGGDLMQEQGVAIVKHFRELAFTGIKQVIVNLPTILGHVKLCPVNPIVEQALLPARKHLFALLITQSQPISDNLCGCRNPSFPLCGNSQDRKHQ